MQELEPRFRKYTKREINSGSGDFHYKNIVEYVTKKLQQDGIEGYEFFPNILMAYSDLSSFVHGGPTADRLSDVMIDEEKTQDEFLHIVEMVSVLNVAIREFVYICFSHERHSCREAVDELADLRYTDDED